MVSAQSTPRVCLGHLDLSKTDPFYLLCAPSRRHMPVHTCHNFTVCVAEVLEEGLTCLIESIGGWILGDLEVPLLHRLLNDNPSFCRAYREDPTFIANSPPPSYGTTSKILVVPAGDSEDVDINDRFSVKMQLSMGKQQLVLKLQASNLRGTPKQMGQFTMNYEQDVLTTNVLETSTSFVPANQSPFVAMMLIHGVMQVIHWYACRNILLSECHIKDLICKVKAVWRNMKQRARQSEAWWDPMSPPRFLQVLWSSMPIKRNCCYVGLGYMVYWTDQYSRGAVVMNR